MLSFNEYRNLVNDAILAIPYPKQPENLYEPIRYTMGMGGKRIRPVLVLMACEAMGGDVNKAVEPAVGLELYHNFTLLHDDVMDKADVRRGMPTVHRRWGDNAAILSGDTMLSMAARHMSHVDDDKLPAVMRLFNDTAIEVCEGQQYDMDYELLANVSVADYMEMIRLKTSVLLGCACKLGAIVAGTSEQDASNLYTVGLNLGLAFQLQDDLLDVWGDEATFGKEIGGDIMNGKKTFLLVNALAMASDDQLAELRRWLNDEYAVKQEKVAAVTAIYEQMGLKQLTEKEIVAYSQKALEALDKVKMPDEAKQQFATFIQDLVGRDK